MKILIVDDNKPFAKSLSRSITSRCDNIDIAHDLISGYRALISQPFKLVLLDYDLGAENGLSLLSKIEHLTHKPSIILMTSYATKEIAIKALNLGVSRFIEKPFKSSELLDLIYELTQKPNLERSISSIDYTITHRDKKVRLTEIEYKIYNFMLSNSNDLVTKEELHQFIYHKEVKSYNVLNTHITNLKHKLPAFSKSLKNIRGQGYVLKNYS